MDENEFFRQATLKLCGNLEIKEALFSTLHFLRNVMPVDGIALQYYDKGLKSVQDIAAVTKTEKNILDFLVPISSNAVRKVTQKFQIKPGEAFLIIDPKSEPFTREMIQFRGTSPTSIIALVVDSGVPATCSVILGTEGDEPFSQKHADLISLLSEPFAIAMSNTLKHREILKLKDLLADDNRYLHSELHRLSGDDIVGSNFGLKNVMRMVQQVAPLDSPVLLLGETGVGKDVIANAIHYSSSRKDGPFISVNCGAIPDTLIDSELFGHEKGAFTGALDQKRGRFERADKGTIFLDEIGELPLQAQVRLLKVLQSKEIERVGGVKTIQLDIRIVAATSRDLEKMIGDQQFREDLFFRLNVFPILIPPLRKRTADVPALLQHFINRKSKELKLPAIPTLSPSAIGPLMEYHWPGNVREFENVIERALILNPTGPLTFEHLHLGPSVMPKTQHGTIDGPDNLDEVLSCHIRRILTKTNGKISGKDGAAALMGLNPSTLRNRMKKLGIDSGNKTIA
ncbi:MAG: sigma-54-dependent Fis family transcriptional regulator [Deltaproteobacteria bacterium]|nr:sigma-54-dependent Fis family transcriptional regulator [Deltaproteobacteria bacterium]